MEKVFKALGWLLKAVVYVLVAIVIFGIIRWVHKALTKKN